MLKTRLITAAFLILGVLIANFYSTELVWGLLAGFITMLGFWEWGRLILLNPCQQQMFLGAGLATCLFFINAFNSTYVRFNELSILMMVSVAAFIWVCLVPIWLAQKKSAFANKVLWSGAGWVLLSATLIAFLGLHKISPWLMLGVIMTVSIADSAAYFAGKNFGRHKLAPSISPGKTWEGVVGALLAVTIYGLALNYFLNYSYWLIVGLLLMTMASVVGDLFESKIKRQANLKDSSQILPGHGGVLDRIDGLMPTALITLFYMYLPLIFTKSIHL